MWDEVGTPHQSKQIMLIGEYRHTMDEKSRLSLPAKFRKEMGKKIIITRGLDQCLFVYPIAEWKKFSEKLAGLSVGSADSRALARSFLGSATEIDVDASGRILIADTLKRLQDLEQKSLLQEFIIALSCGMKKFGILIQHRLINKLNHSHKN